MLGVRAHILRRIARAGHQVAKRPGAPRSLQLHRTGEERWSQRDERLKFYFL